MPSAPTLYIRKIRVTHRLTGDKAVQSGKLDILCNHPLNGWDWRLVD
jgi:hypothetical protein